MGSQSQPTALNPKHEQLFDALVDRTTDPYIKQLLNDHKTQLVSNRMVWERSFGNVRVEALMKDIGLGRADAVLLKRELCGTCLTDSKPPPKRGRLEDVALSKAGQEPGTPAWERSIPAANPQSFEELQDMAILMDRDPGVDIATVPQAVLLSPEMAFIRDACCGYLRGKTPNRYYDAWVGLQTIARCSFDAETDHLAAVYQWQERYFKGAAFLAPINILGKGSRIPIKVKSATRAGNSHGQVAVTWKDVRTRTVGLTATHTYWAAHLQCKSEIGSAGDPMLQLARSYQACYGSYAERWDGCDELLRATGCPAIGVDATGSTFLLYGMCLLRDNVVTIEPLVGNIPLLHMWDPWGETAGAEERGARTLAAYDVALYYLQERYHHARIPSWEPLDIPGKNDHKERVDEVMGSLTNPFIDYAGAFKAVLLKHTEVSELTKQRTTNMSCPLPWPLWGNYANGEPWIKYTDVCVLELPRMPDKKLYVGKHPDGTLVVIKYSTHDYPEQIHNYLHEKGLAPRLVECRPLPGGCCMVVTEKLGDEWNNLAVLEKDVMDDQGEVGCMELKKAIVPGLLQALQQVHGLDVPKTTHPSGSSNNSNDSCAWLERRQSRGMAGKIALGDARVANCMVKLGKHDDGWKLLAVNFVDLDWAGIADFAKYPAVRFLGNRRPYMCAGAHLQQDHDVYQLENTWAIDED